MFRRAGLAMLLVLATGVRGEELSDPTRPPRGLDLDQPVVAGEVPDRAGPLPRLTGIRIDRRSRVAIVDGRAVKVGDMVMGYKVLAIGKGQVKLEGNGEVILPLLPDVKKVKRKGR